MDLKLLFMEWLQLEGLSKATIRDYLNAYSRFPVHEFDQINVNEFLKKENPRSVDRAFINNFREFLIQQNPERHEELIKIRLPRMRGRKKRILPDYPTEDELYKIESAMEKERDKIMLLISFYSALRPQGILKLKRGDFYFEEWLADEERPCKLKVNEKGNKERIVFLDKRIVKRMKPFLSKDVPRDTRLFNIGYARWHSIVTTASKRALGRSISPHKLRHGGATWLLTTKGYTLQEVSEFLGHESIATTQIYAHLDKEKMMDKYSN